jgi:hypothetical protein
MNDRRTAGEAAALRSRPGPQPRLRTTANARSQAPAAVERTRLDRRRASWAAPPRPNRTTRARASTISDRRPQGSRRRHCNRCPDAPLCRRIALDGELAHTSKLLHRHPGRVGLHNRPGPLGDPADRCAPLDPVVGACRTSRRSPHTLIVMARNEPSRPRHDAGGQSCRYAPRPP